MELNFSRRALFETKVTAGLKHFDQDCRCWQPENLTPFVVPYLVLHLTPTILKQCVGVYLPFLTKAINHAITENTFPEQLKKSKVIPLHKKEDPLKKENYRPVSLLPHVSKVFEMIIYKQINIYMQDKLSKHITGFRKSHGTQHSLMTMLEKWKSALDKGENICFIYGSLKGL